MEDNDSIEVVMKKVGGFKLGCSFKYEWLNSYIGVSVELNKI